MKWYLSMATRLLTSLHGQLFYRQLSLFVVLVLLDANHIRAGWFASEQKLHKVKTRRFCKINAHSHRFAYRSTWEKQYWTSSSLCIFFYSDLTWDNNNTIFIRKVPRLFYLILLINLARNSNLLGLLFSIIIDSKNSLIIFSIAFLFCWFQEQMLSHTLSNWCCKLFKSKTS